LLVEAKGTGDEGSSDFTGDRGMAKIIRQLYVFALIIGPLVTVVFYLNFDHRRRIAGMCLGVALFCFGLWGLSQKLLKS